MPNPAPQRQRLRSWPTPKVADVIFRQTFESTRTAVPAYGTAHPDSATYPNHKLVHAKVVEDQGLFLELWYAADRSNQEDYNYSLTFQYGGNPNYPRITRTYILPRSPAPLALGSEDPGGSMFGSGEFFQPGGEDSYRQPGGVFRYFTSAIPAGVLVAQSERPLGDELNGLYVEVTRIYDVIPGLEEGASSDALGQTDDGYTVERPIQDKDWVRLTWKIILPRTIADTYRRDNFDQCPIPGYINLYLADERIEVNAESNQTSTIVRVYEGNMFATPDASVSFSSVVGQSRQIPGIIPPEKFLDSITTKQETKRVLDPAGQNIDAITSPDGSLTLVESRVTPEGTNTGNRIVTATKYSNPGQLTGKSWDNDLRDYMPYTVEVMSPEAAAALPEIAGEELQIQPINRYWSIVTRETPRDTQFDIKSYFSTTPFKWPAVLPSSGDGRLEWGTIKRKNPQTGLPVEDVLFYEYELTPVWSGICKSKVELWWQKEPPDFNGIEAMNPTEIAISWPIGSIRIPSCLHFGYLFEGTTGTDNPRWESVNFSKRILPTNYTEWPDSIIADYDVTPYKGGFRVRRITVYKPNYAAAP
jgi:hypothetical protein